MPGSRQQLNQTPANSFLIGEDHPASARSGFGKNIFVITIRKPGAAGKHQRLLGENVSGFDFRTGDELGEARFGEQCMPSLSGNEGVGVPHVVVRELPPAFRQPDDQVAKTKRPRPLRQEEHAFRSHQLADVGDRVPQVFCCVQHVGRNHKVVGVRLEALSKGIFFDVQDLVLHKGISLEFFPRTGGKQRRDVGKHVFHAPFGKPRQH